MTFKHALIIGIILVTYHNIWNMIDSYTFFYQPMDCEVYDESDDMHEAYIDSVRYAFVEQESKE